MSEEKTKYIVTDKNNTKRLIDIYPETDKVLKNICLLSLDRRPYEKRKIIETYNRRKRILLEYKPLLPKDKIEHGLSIKFIPVGLNLDLDFEVQDGGVIVKFNDNVIVTSLKRNVSRKYNYIFIKPVTDIEKYIEKIKQRQKKGIKQKPKIIIKKI